MQYLLSKEQIQDEINMIIDYVKANINLSQQDFYVNFIVDKHWDAFLLFSLCDLNQYLWQYKSTLVHFIPFPDYTTDYIPADNEIFIVASHISGCQENRRYMRIEQVDNFNKPILHIIYETIKEENINDNWLNSSKLYFSFPSELFTYDENNNCWFHF